MRGNLSPVNGDLYEPASAASLTIGLLGCSIEMGKTYTEIAQVLGANAATVRSAMVRAGAAEPRRKLDIEKIKQMRDQGAMLAEIGDVFGVSRYAVCHALKRARKKAAAQ